MKASTILVVEDNPVTRKMVRMALAGEGYTVLEARDGRTALQLMADQPPDLVLQDLLLPDIDSFELVQRLRSLPGGAQVPILAFSASLSKLDEARNLEAGFSDYVAKPIEPARLLQTVLFNLQP